jgi:uncharacterized spore protein YtfJ
MAFALGSDMISTPEKVAEVQPPPGVVASADAIARVAHEFAEAIRSEGNIRVVFGAPMALDNHKIIPVARVEIGFGGGMGATARGNGLAGKVSSLARVLRRGFGAGGGGGIKVTPIGFIHEDGDRVQYRAITTASANGRVDAECKSCTQSTILSASQANLRACNWPFESLRSALSEFLVSPLGWSFSLRISPCPCLPRVGWRQDAIQKAMWRKKDKKCSRHCGGSPR